MGRFIQKLCIKHVVKGCTRNPKKVNQFAIGKFTQRRKRQFHPLQVSLVLHDPTYVIQLILLSLAELMINWASIGRCFRFNYTAAVQFTKYSGNLEFAL